MIGCEVAVSQVLYAALRLLDGYNTSGSPTTAGAFGCTELSSSWLLGLNITCFIQVTRAWLGLYYHKQEIKYTQIRSATIQQWSALRSLSAAYTLALTVSCGHVATQVIELCRP